MATEKRPKPPISTSSKGSSLIIQLPTTSANNSHLTSAAIHLLNADLNNNSNSSNARDSGDNLINQTNRMYERRSNRTDLEQNNMFNHCLRNNNNLQQARRLGDHSSSAGRATSTAQHTSFTYSNHQQARPLHHHRYHLNNFHNHIDQDRHQSSSSHETDGDDQQAGTPPPNYHEIPGVVPAYQGRSSGPPPAYDDVINPNAPPPSYQSLFGQVREARKTSNGLVDLFRQLFLVLIGTIGCTMIIGFLLLIPITMILIGLVYLNDCRAENIPSFLVIGGSVWIVKNVLNCYNQFKKDSLTSNRPPPRRQPISALSAASQTSSTSSNSSNSDSATSVLVVISPSETAENATFSDNQSSLLADSSSSSSTTNAQQQQQQQQQTIRVTGSSASTSSQTATSSTALSNSNTALPNAPATPNSPTTRRSGAAISTPPQLANSPNHIRHPPMIGLTSYKCESILNYFLIVWFLAGCIVVYRIYEPDYDNPASANYCNRLVYLYAFWLMTSAFIVMAIILSCLCCLMASSLMSCSHGR